MARLTEKISLSVLVLALIAISTIAEVEILEIRGAGSQSWQAEVGFYVPFALFALVSTYHFLEWVKKHKRQAILLMIIIVAISSGIGVVTANAPRPALSSLILQSSASTQQGETAAVQIQRQPESLQQSIIKMRDALNSTPYFSTGFNAIILIASGLAVVLVLVRMRQENRIGPAEPTLGPITNEVAASNPREVVIHCYNLATRSLQTKGVRIPDSDTPLDAFARIKPLEPSVADPFWKLTLLFEEAKFSLHPISEVHSTSATQYCKSIEQHVGVTI
jgi:hypothetical protein